VPITVHTYLVLSSSLLGKSQDSRNGDGQVVSTNVVDLSLLDQIPDLRLLQVLGLVLISGSKVGAHAAVMASDDDTALAGGLNIVDTVFSVDTSLGASVLQEIGVFILANAANVDDRVVGEDVLDNLSKTDFHFPAIAIRAYLSTTSGVLGSTTSNELSVKLHQLIVETHVLVLGEDGVVVLESILLQESGVTELALVDGRYGVRKLSIPDSLNVCESPMLASHYLLFMAVNIPRRGFSKQSKGYPAILIDQWERTRDN